MSHSYRENIKERKNEKFSIGNAAIVPSSDFCSSLKVVGLSHNMFPMLVMNLPS